MGPQGPKLPSAADIMSHLDKNKDGKLTKDEVPAPLWEHLSNADANKDGAVTKDELEAAQKKMQEQFQQRMKDGPGPGKGPQAGPPAIMGRQFGPPGMGPQAGRPGMGPQAGPPGMGMGRQFGSVDDLIKRFDKNKDGKLTKDEVPAPLWERLSKADANKDGAVTKDELEAARKKMEEQRGKQPK